GELPSVLWLWAPVFTPIRLAGGSNAHEGRVEVYHGGQWGTVCDDQWDDADAEVVCRQLGLGENSLQLLQAYFGEGSGPVLLDEVRCTGNELSIEQCPKNSWREHNCGHKEDAGVSCTPLTGTSVINNHMGKQGQRQSSQLWKENFGSLQMHKSQTGCSKCYRFCFRTVSFCTTSEYPTAWPWNSYVLKSKF
uniref:SRCR domain-containing protein n=1 Tax=Malurus cyaneus samueli TaxID=2593467 RepID=A0A8C5TVA1_9PASS